MSIDIDGKLGFGITPKDIILYIIGKIGTAGATGYVMESTRSATVSFHGRSRIICNMNIEAGGRAGIIFPRLTKPHLIILKAGDFSPKGADWDKAVAYWRPLSSDAGAKHDLVVSIKAEDIKPQVTLERAAQVTSIEDVVPDPESFTNPCSSYRGLGCFEIYGSQTGNENERYCRRQSLYRILH